MNEKEREIFVPPSGPPQGGRPSPEIFKAMGEENIFCLIRDFYGELERSSIKHLFPKNMQAAADRSAAFFVFLLGGPPLYQQKYGPPMMRKRHLPFEIDESARQVWLECFRKTLSQAEEKYDFPSRYQEEFWQFLVDFSGWMVNTKNSQ